MVSSGVKRLSTKNLNLIDLWRVAINAVDGRSAVSRYFEDNPQNFRYVIAIGKAAGAMFLGAYDKADAEICQSLLITKYGHVDSSLNKIDSLKIVESGHPVPDEQSLQAGRMLVDFVQTIPPNDKVLFLISGGTSALVEVLSDNMSLMKWQKMNEGLIASGRCISDVNRERKLHSKIKGGKLARLLKGRAATALYISDVPGDELSMIGSGLLCPDEETLGESHFDTIKNVIVANNNIACRFAANLAEERGFSAFWQRAIVVGDIIDVSSQIYLAIKNGQKGVYIWGGEPTIMLPTSPGKGGRNQALALLLAEKISGEATIQILVAGTDGTDGPTEAAGGLIDGDTISKGSALGLDSKEHIQQANAYPYLKATGCLFLTGATGTNVMDLIIAIKH